MEYFIFIILLCVLISPKFVCYTVIYYIFINFNCFYFIIQDYKNLILNNLLNKFNKIKCNYC